MRERTELRPMVTSENTILDTTLATMERPGGERAELRFKLGQRITLSGILEIFAQLERNKWATPREWLVVFPDEPIVIEFVAMLTDHVVGRPANSISYRLAVAVGDPSNMPRFQQYFATFPSEITVGIFLTEEEARAWLG